MTPFEAKEDLKASGLCIWQFAKYLGVCEMTLTRRFREPELSTDMETKLREFIEGKKNEND